MYVQTNDLHRCGDVTVGGRTTSSKTECMKALGRCLVRVASLLVHRRLHQPRDNLGLVISFADGTSAAVYRETSVVRQPPQTPVYLAVTFRLRMVGGRQWAHALFRSESLLNTVFFAGFPGLVSKLWLRHDQQNRYRGLYCWDGPIEASRYVNALWWVLDLVSVPGSIEYAFVPGFECSQILAQPSLLQEVSEGSCGWWRPTARGLSFGVASHADSGSPTQVGRSLCTRLEKAREFAFSCTASHGICS